MPIYEFECDQCKRRIEKILRERPEQFGPCSLFGPDKACTGTLRIVWSAPRLNMEFPTQLGGVHSMAGFGKRARHRQGD